MGDYLEQVINKDAVRRPQSRYAAGELIAGDYEKATDRQVGGNHYKGFKIQPIEFSMANGLNACQHSAIKYIIRKKGDKAKRVEDIDKAIHFLQIYREMIERGDAE